MRCIMSCEPSAPSGLIRQASVLGMPCMAQPYDRVSMGLGFALPLLLESLPDGTPAWLKWKEMRQHHIHKNGRQCNED